MEGITHAVYTVLVNILPLLLWLTAIMPIILQHTSSMENIGQCSSAVEVLQSVYKNGDLYTLGVYVSCRFRTACWVVKEFIPVGQVSTVSNTLLILACLTTLVASVFHSVGKIRSTVPKPITIVATENIEISEDTLCGSGQDTNATNIESSNSKKRFVSSVENTDLVSEMAASVWLVCLLCVLVTLAHTFAHHFSLGLFLTILYLPNMIFVTHVQSCTMKTAKWKLVACRVCLAAVLVYQGIVMLYMENWFSVHTYAYKLCITLSCIVCIGVSSTMGVLIRFLRRNFV